MKSNFHKIFLLLLVVFPIRANLAQGITDPQTLPVYNASGTITVDGMLNEADWQSSTPYLMFRAKAVATGNANTPTAGVTVKEPYKDSSVCKVKFLKQGTKLYISLDSDDKQVCRFDWEGDGMFMKLKKADGNDVEYKLFVSVKNNVPQFVLETNGDTTAVVGKGLGKAGTTIYDSSNVDAGYVGEMMIDLAKLGYTAAVSEVQLLITIFDPDNYSMGVGAWGANGNYYKQWWGSEWGGTYRKLQFVDSSVEPAAVTLLIPVNDAVDVVLPVQLGWRAAEAALRYQVQVSTNNAFSSFLVNDSTVTDTSKTLTNCLNNTRYYWRVRSINNAGKGVYSEVRNFTTVPLLPQAPVLASPVNGASNIDNAINLSWSSVSGATKYRVQLSADAVFATYLIDDSTITTTSRGVSGLEFNRYYYWRVYAANNGGWSSSSSIFSFRTKNYTVAAPLLFLPQDRALFQPTGLALQWQSTANAEKYHVQLAKDSLFTVLVKNDTIPDGNSYTVTGLLFNTRYFWRVRGVNNSGVGAFSEVRSFTTIFGDSLLAAKYTLIISDSTGVTRKLNFGLHPTATDSIDADLNETALPPVPPVGIMDARFLLGNNLAVANDYRYGNAMQSTSTVHTLQIQQGAVDRYIIRWALPRGVTGTLQDVITGALFTVTLADSGQCIISNPVLCAQMRLTMNYTFLPDVPVLQLPVNNAVGTVLPVKLVWRSANAAVKYQLQVSTSNTFNSYLVNDSTITDTFKTITNCANATKYYWRVRAVNALGSSSYSTVFNFTTIGQLPGAVTLVSPANGVSGLPTSNTLTWNAVAGATKYRLLVAADAAYANLLYMDSTITTTSKALTGFNYATVYYWKVQAANSVGWGEYSPSWFFSTVVATAIIPRTIFFNGGMVPLNLSTWAWGQSTLQLQAETGPVTGSNALLWTQGNEWNNGWSGIGATVSPAFSASGFWKTGYSSITLKCLQTTGSLRIQYEGGSGKVGKVFTPAADTLWHTYLFPLSEMVYQDNTSGFDSSAINVIGLMAEASAVVGKKILIAEWWLGNAGLGYPGVPLLTLPAYNATAVPTTVNFLWQSIDNATSYQFQLAKDSLFNDIVRSDTGLPVNSVSVSGLTGRTTYYWKVQAKNAFGTSGSSLIYKFTTRRGNGSAAVNIPIQVVNGTASKALAMGFDSLATNGLDPELDEESLPPVPPSEIFDARFQLPSSTIQSLSDFRPDTVHSAQWIIKLQRSNNTPQLLVTWNKQAIPADKYLNLRDNITGTLINISMKSQDSIIITNPLITELVIEYSYQLCMENRVNTSWNLVSVPVIGFTMSAAAVFPSRSTQVYGFSGGYTVNDTLECGKGYWVGFTAQAVNSVCGLGIPTAVELKKGWNLIGPFKSKVPVSSMVTVPAGIIASPLYGYAEGYTYADSLIPGKGYWLRTNRAGVLSYAGQGMERENSSPDVNPEKYVTIQVTDAAGRSGSVYITRPGHGETEAGLLPPLPPADAFDVRFNSENKIVTLAGEEQKLCWQGAMYPVTIRIAGISKLHFIDAATRGKLLDATCSNERVITINDKSVQVLLVSETATPEQFALQQNYPNPFNPVTNIKYTLSERCEVRIEVYNSLGEMADILVHEQQNPGAYTIQWNAAAYASGVYYCKLRAGAFTAIRKLILMK